MKKIKLSVWIMISLAVSIVIGLLLQGRTDIADMVSPLGTLYVNLIKMIMVPLVFSSLVVGTSSIGNIRQLGKMGAMTVGIFLGTTAVAVVIGLAVSLLMVPGKGVVLLNEAYEITEFPSVIDNFVGIVPGNPFAALNEGNMLQIIFIAIVLGIGITIAGEAGDKLRGGIESLFNVMNVITKGVMCITPIGVMGLMIPVVANNGIKILLPLIKVIAAFYLAVLIHLILVYCSLIKCGTRISIKEFFNSMFPALVIAFTSCSSAAALPVSMHCVQDKLKVSKEAASFVLPLGATINMDGNALYQGIVALFVAQAYGVEMTVPMMLMVILTGTFASIGAAGVPGAGMIVLSTVLLSVGLPVDGVALVAGIDRILDMGRTFINVTGDAITATIVSRKMSG